MRASLILLTPFVLFHNNVGGQTYEASMTTVPFFNGPYNTAHPPACNVTFLNAFSSGVWDWIHGLIEFAIRNNDFQLDGFTMSDAPYTRYLELLASAKDDEERRVLATVAANTCKTCKYLGCYVWSLLASAIYVQTMMTTGVDFALRRLRPENNEIFRAVIARPPWITLRWGCRYPVLSLQRLVNICKRSMRRNTLAWEFPADCRLLWHLFSTVKKKRRTIRTPTAKSVSTRSCMWSRVSYVFLEMIV
jgi:hypothetical protein